MHSSHSAGSQDDPNESRLMDVALGRHRPRATSVGSLATQSSTTGHPSPTAATVTKAMPSLFSTPTQLRSHSPTSTSSPTFLSRADSIALHSRNSSQMHVSTDGPFQDPNAARIGQLDNRDPRSSPNHVGGQPQGPDLSAAPPSGSPLSLMQANRCDSSISSTSSMSALSSVRATPSSHMSMAVDQRAQRTLPPLSMLGLDVREKFSPGKSPSTSQSAPFLKSTFNPSTTSSSGRSPTLSLTFILRLKPRQGLSAHRLTAEILDHSYPGLQIRTMA